MEENVSRARSRDGIVVSTKMQKTVVVRVDRMAKHPLYGKPVIHAKKYQVHDEENTCRMGDRVRIVETRPLSRHKRWTLAEVLERAPILTGSDGGEA
ncbi:MAG TPA: 30S ribosomal protein S17 [Synergistaceae bacterium]|nr:30S ribosomal protein S17 [Synergistaceae bacterium]HQF90943.1 30S ribosomal protein S17 [Synergistaceae bacterium]HQH78578.1 30S ribosomal protein S17 [Synergistaceae bacterium]HQK24261.1 30S ribosomal protein S17 [Synergistaceae bacterium]